MNQWLTKLVVLFNNWFMSYKVERGRLSFQCGTTKLPKVPTWSSHWPLKQKLFPQFVSIALLKKKKKIKL